MNGMNGRNGDIREYARSSRWNWYTPHMMETPYWSPEPIPIALIFPTMSPEGVVSYAPFKFTLATLAYFGKHNNEEIEIE